jgi:putative ATPase
MIESGEDPLYVARRMIRFASEDVGLADPRALTLALAARETVEVLGMPEAALALAEAALYLALAPKSNAVYVAWKEAAKDVGEGIAPPVPLHLRNAVTSLMESVGYGRGYEYAHDTGEGVAAMDCLPEELKGRRYYRPTDRGLEKALRERLEYLAGAVDRAGRKDRDPR